MVDIDAIMELAHAMEPAAKARPEFMMWCDKDGKWHAKVTMSMYYVLSENNNTPEDALLDIRGQLTKMSQTWLSRLTDTIKRWTGGTPKLRVVKGG